MRSVSAAKPVTQSQKVQSQQVQAEKPVVLAAAETASAEPVADATVPAAPALGADGFPLPAQKSKAVVADIPKLASDKSPLEVANSTPKGQLKNPYKDGSADLVAFGKKKYLGASCNGCHGGNGGGGMCPPLSNETWVYGSDDDTLFRLIALGSDELQKQYNMTRKGRENVVGPMPGHGAIIKTEDDMWRIISFIRANFRGDPKNKPVY
ncbi:MAG: cytochrome C [Methylotenera sp.]|nr:MAG: cytochrome C [Methylotenera sp.]